MGQDRYKAFGLELHQRLTDRDPADAEFGGKRILPELARAGRYEEAMPLCHWFMPLLHLDARPDLVQCIKLCEHIVGRGTHLTRPPRLALTPAEKAEVEGLMKAALANRPKLPDVGLKTAA